MWCTGPTVVLKDEATGLYIEPNSIATVFAGEEVPLPESDLVTVFIDIDYNSPGIPQVVGFGVDKGHQLSVKDVRYTEDGTLEVMVDPFKFSTALEEDPTFQSFLENTARLQSLLCQTLKDVPDLEPAQPLVDSRSLQLEAVSPTKLQVLIPR
jgi:hypothetical protein